MASPAKSHLQQRTQDAATGLRVSSKVERWPGPSSLLRVSQRAPHLWQLQLLQHGPQQRAGHGQARLHGLHHVSAQAASPAVQAHTSQLVLHEALDDKVGGGDVAQLRQRLEAHL
jgi:hypothetical protein